MLVGNRRAIPDRRVPLPTEGTPLASGEPRRRQAPGGVGLQIGRLDPRGRNVRSNSPGVVKGGRVHVELRPAPCRTRRARSEGARQRVTLGVGPPQRLARSVSSAKAAARAPRRATWPGMGPRAGAPRGEQWVAGGRGQASEPRPPWRSTMLCQPVHRHRWAEGARTGTRRADARLRARQAHHDARRAESHWLAPCRRMPLPPASELVVEPFCVWTRRPATRAAA